MGILKYILESRKRCLWGREEITCRVGGAKGSSGGGCGQGPLLQVLAVEQARERGTGQTWWNQAKLVHGLPGMGSQVAQQVRVAAEAAATLCARVGPGPRVHQHVPQQVAAAAEALAAL